MRNDLRSSLLLAAAIALAAAPAKSWASAPAAPGPGSAVSEEMPAFVQDIASEAADAVKVVDAFSAAIKAAKLDEAESLLDPGVLILESGGAERSRDEYMGGHAIADAAFLKNSRQVLRYRKARAEGNFAWVATESTLEGQEDGKKVLMLSTETMLLRRTGLAWKIVHIHWSSRGGG